MLFSIYSETRGPTFSNSEKKCFVSVQNAKGLTFEPFLFALLK